MMVGALGSSDFGHEEPETVVRDTSWKSGFTLFSFPLSLALSLSFYPFFVFPAYMFVNPIRLRGASSLKTVSGEQSLKQRKAFRFNVAFVFRISSADERGQKLLGSVAV